MIWMFVSVLLLSALIGLVIAFTRLARIVFKFDDLFDMLVDEIDTNVKYFEKMANMQIMSNVPEVKQAHHNMMIMQARLIEYVLRINELMNRPQKKTPIARPPIVR